MKGAEFMGAFGRILSGIPDMDTAQVFLDVYSDKSDIFIRPLKVWNKYSETMFMPHSFNMQSNKMVPLSDSIKVSRFYELMNTAQYRSDNQSTDSWDRF